MHELSLVETIVENVTNLAKKSGAHKVKSLTLSIGALSGVVKDSIEFCFPLVARGTILEEAELIISEVPLKVRCKKCNKVSMPDGLMVRCEECTSTEVEVIEGLEFKMVSMEIE